jgi:hypothetical protein
MALVGLPDIGSLTLDMEAVAEGAEAYILYGLDGLGVSLSMAMWVLEDQLLMNFPELSELYLLISDISDMGELPDTDEIMRELGKVMNKTLDRYFELTKGVQSSGTVEVVFGGITKNADVYEVTLDGHLLIGIAEALLEAVLDSPALMKMLEEYVDITELLDEIDNTPSEYLDLVAGTMNVYISGRDVVKREFVLAADDTEIIISYTDLKNGSNYANALTFSFDDGWDSVVFGYTDMGRELSGAKSGYVNIGITTDAAAFNATAAYTDIKTDSNGLWSGSIDITMPIPTDLIDMFAYGMGDMFSELEVRIKVDAEVSGNTQNTTASVIFLGMRVADIEAVTTINTGKRIPAHNATPANTIDMNDWEAMWEFGQDVEDALYDLLAGSLLDSLGLLDMLGGGYSFATDDSWDIDYYDDGWVVENWVNPDWDGDLIDFDWENFDWDIFDW